MKKTIKNVVLGVLTLLAFVTGSSAAEEPKKEDSPQGGILKKEVLSELQEKLKGAKISDAQIEAILKSVKSMDGINKTKSKVITRTMTIGPDGKLQEIENGGKGGLDLGELLSEIEDGDVKKLLSENRNAIVSGKVVIIDGEGNRIEKDLTEGGNLNEMLQGALKGVKLDLQMGGLDLKKSDSKGLAAKLDKIEKEMAEQRLLLEEILKKLK